MGFNWGISNLSVLLLSTEVKCESNSYQDMSKRQEFDIEFELYLWEHIFQSQMKFMEIFLFS